MIQDIVAVEWATSNSLNLGSNDYTPALVLHVIKPSSGEHAQLQQAIKVMPHCPVAILHS